MGDDNAALSPAQWTIVAKACLGGDLSARSAATFAEVDVDVEQAAAALDRARQANVIDRDGMIDEMVRARLVGDLPSDVRSHVHTKAARGLLAAGPQRLPEALHHLRSAATLPNAEGAVELADHAGRLSLSLGDYASAALLLGLAADYDVSTDLVGDAAFVARAAIAHALPVDWHAGDQRTHALLDRAHRLSLSHHDRVAVTGARAMAEMRLPVIAGDQHQVAWVTRPSVAQPLADQALTSSVDCPPLVKCLAALAWRSTHRAPGYLDRRRDLSSQALQLAQNARMPSFQLEAAVWLAVDALESGDRALFDGDHEGTAKLLRQTTAIVSRFDTSLVQLVQTFFTGQLVISDHDPAVLAALSPQPTIYVMAHPIGRAGAAYFWARSGQGELAVKHTRRALVQRDAESSLLLVGTRAAAVACETGDEALCHEIMDILSPYAGHVAVDSNGWWCDGPVAVW